MTWLPTAQAAWGGCGVKHLPLIALAACGGPANPPESEPVDLCHLGDEVIAYRHALGQPRVPADRIYSVANPPVWAMPCDGWRAVVLERVPGQARVRPAHKPWLEAGWIAAGWSE